MFMPNAKHTKSCGTWRTLIKLHIYNYFCEIKKKKKLKYLLSNVKYSLSKIHFQLFGWINDSSHPCRNSCPQCHRTNPAPGSPPLSHSRTVADIPRSHLDHNKGRGTGSHFHTHGSTPGWGPAHNVRSHTDYLGPHTVGSTPVGDRAQLGNPAGAHTFQTRNFAPAHNDPRVGSTAAVAVGHTVASQSRNQTDNPRFLDMLLVVKFGKLHAAFCRSQAHFQLLPLSFETRSNFPVVLPMIFARHVVGRFAWHPVASVLHWAEPVIYSKVSRVRWGRVG